MGNKSVKPERNQVNTTNYKNVVDSGTQTIEEQPTEKPKPLDSSENKNPATNNTSAKQEKTQQNQHDSPNNEFMVRAKGLTNGQKQNLFDSESSFLSTTTDDDDTFDDENEKRNKIWSIHSEDQTNNHDDDENEDKNKNNATPLGAKTSNSEIHEPTSNDKIAEWKNLIQELTANKELTSYGMKKTSRMKTVKEVGEYLSKCPKATSDIEKAWIVYLWITHNISYDIKSFLKANNTFSQPESVVERGMAISAGFAALFKELCNQLNVKCLLFSGYSKSIDYKIGTDFDKENHSWNAIEFENDDGEAQLKFIDPTCGSGFFTSNTKFVRKFKPHWFFVPQHVFDESNYSMTESPTGENRQDNLEEFQDGPFNKLEYHIFGLKCLDNDIQSVINTSKNPLIIEYTSPEKLKFVSDLVDQKTGYEEANTTIVQTDSAVDEELEEYKYCLIADIPKKGKTYLLRLYGVASDDDESEEEENKYNLLSQYLVTRDGNKYSNLPKYNISLDHEIKLISHNSQFIRFATNPLVMEFEIPSSVGVVFSLTDRDETKERNILEQRNPDNREIVTVFAALPKQNETYLLHIFINSNGKLKYVNKFHLVRVQSNENDRIQFCEIYKTKFENFIYSPIEYYLKSDKSYEFKYFIKDALDVALVDADDEWYILERSDLDPNIWSLDRSFNAVGKLTVFAKFNETDSYTGICYYKVN